MDITDDVDGTAYRIVIDSELDPDLGESFPAVIWRDGQIVHHEDGEGSPAETLAVCRAWIADSH